MNKVLFLDFDGVLHATAELIPRDGRRGLADEGVQAALKEWLQPDVLREWDRAPLVGLERELWAMPPPKKVFQRFTYQFDSRHLLISPGWLPLFKRLCEDIDQLLGEYRRGFGWTGIKTKYGGLRLDYQIQRQGDAISREIDQRIDAAEDASESICEVCGPPGLIEAQAHWLDCLCTTHRRQRREVQTGDWREQLNYVRLYEDEEGAS